MPYFVIDIDTAKNPIDKAYSTKGWANVALNHVREKYPSKNFKVMDEIEWDSINVEVEVRHLINPEVKVKIRKSEVGTCCDPSTERYWSM